MKSSVLVKIFGLFLASIVAVITATLFINPSYFTDSSEKIANNTSFTKTSVEGNKFPSSVAQQQGQKYYQTYCASCHGATGEGNGPTALNFSKPPPNFLNKAQPFKNGFHKAGIAKTLEEGISNSPMPAFSYLSDEVKKSLAEYLFELRS